MGTLTDAFAETDRLSGRVSAADRAYRGRPTIAESAPAPVAFTTGGARPHDGGGWVYEYAHPDGRRGSIIMDRREHARPLDPASPLDCALAARVRARGSSLSISPLDWPADHEALDVQRLVNLTPHTIRLRAPYGATAAEPHHDDIVLASSGVARVSTAPALQVGSTHGIPIYAAPSYGAIEGLPTPVPGTIYVVSAMVAARCTGRDDVCSPGTGPRDGAVRTADGQVYAVTRLVRGT